MIEPTHKQTKLNQKKLMTNIKLN